MRLLTAVLLSLTLVACSSDDREKLVIYSPHGKEMLRYYEDAFEAAYPEVDVQWLDMGGQDAYDRIRTESANPQASLWWGGDSPAFARAADEDLLAPYTPTWADALPAEAHDAQYRWVGMYYTPEVIAYNTRAFEGAIVPGAWDDLLAPEYADRVLIRYPLASSTMRTIWGAMILRQPTVQDGYAWLARLDVNVKTYTADPTQLYLKLARGEGDLTLWNMPDTYIQANLNNYPFGFVLPQEGTPVLVDGIAIVKGGPSPARAQQFYEFVTSADAIMEQAEQFQRIPIRTDLDAAQLPEWITQSPIVPMDIAWDRLASAGPTWMQYWDENIKGRGPEGLAENGYSL